MTNQRHHVCKPAHHCPPVAKQPLPPPTARFSTVSTEVVTAVLVPSKRWKPGSEKSPLPCQHTGARFTNPFIDVEKIITAKEVRADLNSNAPKAPMKAVAVPPVTTTDTSISSSQVVAMTPATPCVVSTTIEGCRYRLYLLPTRTSSGTDGTLSEWSHSTRHPSSPSNDGSEHLRCHPVYQ